MVHPADAYTGCIHGASMCVAVERKRKYGVRQIKMTPRLLGHHHWVSGCSQNAWRIREIRVVLCCFPRWVSCTGPIPKELGTLIQARDALDTRKQAHR